MSRYLAKFKVMWAEIDNHFDPKFVFTPEGHAFIQTYAIKASHPELPFGMHLLAMMAALSNGAQANMFLSGGSLLFLFHLNVNYAQTRKSSITGNADMLGNFLDDHIRKLAKTRFEEL